MYKKSTKKIPLGIKLNNPGNVRYSLPNNWRGQISQEKGFVKFISIEHGVRAIAKILLTYQKYLANDTTISNIISRYAPPVDNNDTNNYIGIVSYMCDTPPHSYYDVSDFYKLFALVSAICRVETGYTLDFDFFKKSMKL